MKYEALLFLSLFITNLDCAEKKVHAETAPTELNVQLSLKEKIDNIIAENINADFIIYGHDWSIADAPRYSIEHIKERIIETYTFKSIEGYKNLKQQDIDSAKEYIKNKIKEPFDKLESERLARLEELKS